MIVVNSHLPCYVLVDAFEFLGTNAWAGSYSVGTEGISDKFFDCLSEEELSSKKESFAEVVQHLDQDGNSDSSSKGMADLAQGVYDSDESSIEKSVVDSVVS